MIREISSPEIDDLLSQQIVGRIGCYYENEIYVVPISYAYEDNAIYCHGFEGKKMEMMRKNPKVCFQVDEMKEMGNWKSVIAWGEYQEIKNERDRYLALKLFVDRLMHVKISSTAVFSETEAGRMHPASVTIKPVVYRIILTEKSGRFEND